MLHFDTEQSPEDHYDLIDRTLARAGLTDAPPWFHSYCLTDDGLKDRKKALFRRAETAVQIHGGLCAIFLDGIGDLCDDVNDGPGSNALVDMVYGMAIKYRCPFVNVLHENPGTDIGKTRGHLGSQLERKAASNLRLEKDGKNNVIQLWGEKLRRGHIAKGQGPSFIWSEERNMHISCLSAKEVDEIEAATASASKREKLLVFLRDNLEVGEKRKAGELNDLALKLKHDFACAGQPGRFADRIKEMLGDESGFRVYKAGSAINSPYAVERLASAALVAAGDELTAGTV